MSLNAHPELPEFDYIRPPTLKEASQFLSEHAGEARPLLGGTDVFVRMRDGFWKEKYLVDIKRLDGINQITFDPEKGLTIGAAVNMNKVIVHPAVVDHYPLLASAARSVASYQLRSRATIVGNICNASPAGDTIGACLLLGGVLNVFNQDGLRQIALDKFFTGPGKSVLKPGDIVTSISLPIPPKGGKGVYFKLGRNKLSDLSIVGLTAYGYKDTSKPSGYSFSIAIASVAPTPFIASAAAEYLGTYPISEETITTAAEAAMNQVNPIDDVRGSARYRKLMVRNLTYKAITQLWEDLR
jgi:carbon-monoxide dehydrogenase medium subunit